MRGLAPRFHAAPNKPCGLMDCRVKPGHDSEAEGRYRFPRFLCREKSMLRGDRG
jgi:hypothetical protein